MQLLRNGSWVANVRLLTSFTVRNASVDEGWVIRRDGVDEACTVA